MDESDLRAGRLCVVGNVNRDIRTAPFRAGDHLFGDGETSVGAIVETIGGGGANSACVAAALGARVVFLGKVGADGLGLRLEQRLRAWGVEARLAKDPAVATGTSINLTFDHGPRHFISWLPNNHGLRFEDLDLEVLSGCDHLYRADIWFSAPMLFGGNERLFRAARARGLAVSIDLNWDPRWGVGETEAVRVRKQAIRAVLPWVTLAHGNARELAEFTDAPDLISALRRLADWGVAAVVVHLGAEGAGYFERGQWMTEPAVPADRRINTTGTGDVLSTCMMLLHRQADARAKLRLANRIVTEFIEGKRALIPEL
jgi:2-dehydro-3-deoxygluconokinase